MAKRGGKSRSGGTIKTAAPKTTKAPLGYIKTSAPAVGLSEINAIVQQQPLPLPTTTPAPLPAPVAPLPNIDLSNLDLSNVPGLPQLPPITVEPAPAPVPVTPPPLPPQPVPPPPAPVVEPAPAPVPVTPPPTPPVPVAPPPAPVPTPAPPPIVPPVLTAPSTRVSEPAPAPAPTPVAPPAPVLPTPAPATIPPIDLSNIDLSNLDLSNINVPSMPAAAPTPPPVPTLTPEPSPLVPPVQTAPSNRVSEPAPEPAVGIETLAPDDFTAPVTPPFSPSEQMGFNALEPQDGPFPAGIAAGPMSTPSVNTRAEAVEAGIPMPDGSQFNLENLDLGGFEVDPEIIQNALAEAGIETPATGGASTFTPNLDAGLTLGDTLLTEPTPTASSFQPEAGGFTLTPEQQAAIDAAIGSGSFSLIDDSYGFTDGQQDAAGVIPGAGAAANATTNASTNPNAGQDWYENMTDEQREAYDAFIAGGGLANIPGGTIDLSAIGGGTVNIPGYTGTTPRPVVEAIQNLTVNRDPTLAGNVSAATQYGLTGAAPVQAPSTNPFQRPETQQGIGSLAGGG